MSFGAVAAWQAWLLFGAAAAVAAGLFLIKVRPPRVTVPSLVLWQRVLDQARQMTWWERVRRAVSLAATILIAVALTAALTRPGPAVTAASQGRLLIVLDSSWSMLARTTGGATRWDRARGMARALAASSAGNDIALATTSEGLVEGPTGDLALIDAAIDQLRPTGSERGDWPRVPGGAAVHFFTDGALDRGVDPTVIVHSVYESAANVAITAFGVRPPVSAGGPAEAYLEVANYATTPQDVRLVVSRGTAVVQDAPVALTAGQVARTTITVPPQGDARLKATISAPANALAIDDEAVAWVPGAESTSIVVVSDQPGALQQLLQRAPGIRATFVTAAAYRPGTEAVVVFDRSVPAAAPARPALFIAPPPAAWLGTPGTEERQVRWTKASLHPVLAGVDPLTVEVKRTRGFEGPGLQPVARSEAGTPLVSVVDEPARRYVVVAFAFADSNLPFAPAFPVLMGNAIDWLAGPAEATGHRPGRLVVASSTTAVTGPDGAVPIVRFGDHGVVTLPAPGFYTIDAGGSRRTLAVNVGDPQVSNLERSTTSATRSGGDLSTSVPAGRPWWLYALVVAFVLLSLEWWTWQRRITV